MAAVTVLADIYNVNRNLIDSGKYVHRRNEGTGKKKCRFFKDSAVYIVQYDEISIFIAKKVALVLTQANFSSNESIA